MDQFDLIEKVNRCKVLSIQSHVVRGYVGNRAAVFPLQFLGYDVDFINSVQYAGTYVHEGYKCLSADLKHILDALPSTQLPIRIGQHPGPLNAEVNPSLIVNYDYLLTGYVGNSDFLAEVCAFVINQKAKGAHLKWICDPVIGDNGQPYVPIDVLKFYESNCLGLADLITPNQYELGWLANHAVDSVENILECCNIIHLKGVQRIVVTSVGFTNESFLLLIGSEKKNNADREAFSIQFPRLPIFLCGTGDLMSAMLLHYLNISNDDLKEACEYSLTMLTVSIRLNDHHQNVINRTIELNTRAFEIDIIGSRDLFSKNLKYWSATKIQLNENQN